MVVWQNVGKRIEDFLGRPMAPRWAWCADCVFSSCVYQVDFYKQMVI